MSRVAESADCPRSLRGASAIDSGASGSATVDGNTLNSSLRVVLTRVLPARSLAITCTLYSVPAEVGVSACSGGMVNDHTPLFMTSPATVGRLLVSPTCTIKPAWVL